MSDWVINAVESMGYWGVVLLMLLENVVPPIPSELIMPLAGYQAARGEMTFWGVVAAGTAGSVLGALPLYYLGRVIGEDRLRRWIERRGHWLALSPEDLDKGKAWFARRGGAAVFLCRLVPGVRSLISIPAGVHKMPLLPFLLYTTVGTALWAGLLAYAGSLLGQNYRRVEHWVGPVTYVVLGGIVIAFVIRVVRLRRRRHARRAAPAAIEHSHGHGRRAESWADPDRALHPGRGARDDAREPAGGRVRGPVA
jgi:membrane protein DedA with SNARE-associated domain